MAWCVDAGEGHDAEGDELSGEAKAGPKKQDKQKHPEWRKEKC